MRPSPVAAAVAGRLVSIAVAVLAFGTAQSAPVPPAWTRDFAAPIQWQRVTAFGQLLVSTTAALHSVDPTTGQVVWSQRDLANPPRRRARGACRLAARAHQRRRGESAHRRPQRFQRSARLRLARRRSRPDLRAAWYCPAPAHCSLRASKSASHSRSSSCIRSKTVSSSGSDVLNTAMNPGGNALMSSLMSAALVMVDVDPVQSAPLEQPRDDLLLGAMGHVMRIEQATGKVLSENGVRRRHVRIPPNGLAARHRLRRRRADEQQLGAEETATQPRIETFYQGFRLADGGAIWNGRAPSGP